MYYSIGDCHFIIHAEGPEDGIDEFVFQLTEAEWEPRYPLCNPEVFDLEPREDGMKRIEVRGECYSVEEAFLNPNKKRGIASLRESSKELDLQIEVMGEDTTDLMIAEHCWYRGRKSMEEESKDIQVNEWRANGYEMEGYESFEEYAKAEHLPETMDEEDWSTPGYIGYRPWFDDRGGKGEELGDWDWIGNAGPRSAGPINRKIRVFIEDEMPADNGQVGNIALVQERRIGSRNRPWGPNTLADNFGYNGGNEWTLRRDAIEWDGASSKSVYDEMHLIQSYASDYANWTIQERAVPSGRKQLWSEVGNLLDHPGRTFVNIVLAYSPEENEPMHIWVMLSETRRTMKVIHKRGLANLGEVAYVRVVQRKATNKEDVGAHVSIRELNSEFAKEWGYPRDGWYGRPTVVWK